MQSEMEADGGEWAEDEEEKAEAGEVEKERGVMPEDEEVKAEGGEVEKERFQWFPVASGKLNNIFKL